MADAICILMGLMDILAGGLVIFGFSNSILAVIFGAVLIGKGGFSFV